MDSNVYVASGASAVVVSTLIQLLKRSDRFPWITQNSSQVNAWISAAAALVTAIGISWSFDFNPDTGQFTGAFSGNLTEVLHTLEHAFVQWCGQHTVYQGLIKPAAMLEEIAKQLAEQKKDA